MAEKRFTIDETTSDMIICDNGKMTYWADDYDDIRDMVELLNAQHEEIQDQKRQLDELDGLLNKFEITFEELEDILYMNRSRL